MKTRIAQVIIALLSLLIIGCSAGDKGPDQATIEKLLIGSTTYSQDGATSYAAKVTAVSKIVRGEELEANGGSIPQGTKLYPVKATITSKATAEELNIAPKTEELSLFFYQDSFKEWKMEPAN